MLLCANGNDPGERKRGNREKKKTKGFMTTKKCREKGIQRMNEGNLYLIMEEMLY